MAVSKKTHEPLKLKTHNCTLFAVTVEIEEKDFLRDSFVKALPAESLAKVFEERRQLRVYCNRQGKKIDYRAFVDIHPYGEKPRPSKVHLHMVLEPTTALRAKGEKSPFAEEIFQWLYGFVSPNANIELSERAEFVFSTSAYRSAFSLPLLLSGTINPIENEIFEGSQMVGVLVNLQTNKAGVRFAQQQVSKKSIFVRLNRSVDTTTQKLMTIEDDVVVLGTIALSTVKPIRRKK